MGTSTNILRKLAIKAEVVQDPRVYIAPDTLIGFNSSQAKQEHEMIEDESIVGVAFKDLPLQSIRKVTGTIEADAEDTSIATMLAVAFGADSSQVYTMPDDKNERSVSMVYLDEVKTNKYAGCFLNNLKFDSSSGEGLKWSLDYIGYLAEVRDDTAYPTPSINPGNRFLHQQLCGTGSGYFRIGDQANALDSGDNNDKIESLSLGFNWAFDFMNANCQQSLLPLSGQGGRPEATFEFVIARHDADTFLAWRDARTQLQADILYYGSATSQLQFEIPNFVVTAVEKTDDDVTKLNVTLALARNGLGTNYTNSNMTFNSPIRATLTNS